MKILIIVRAGHGSIHPAWTRILGDKVDIALSVYDETTFDTRDFKFIHHCVGGKFEGLQNFFAKNDAVIEHYDYFWLFEDDLLLPSKSFQIVRQILSHYEFALACPALSVESFFSWPITVANSNFLFRGTDFVEVMAPIMSRSFLKECLPFFSENYSAWGYEWLWRKFLRNRNEFAVIIDGAPIVHTRRQGSGTLYSNAKRGVLAPSEEMKALFEKYELDRNESFNNMFGMKVNQGGLVFGHQFIAELISGYRRVYDDARASFALCAQFAIRDSFIVDNVEELLRFEGADKLLVPIEID